MRPPQIRFVTWFIFTATVAAFASSRLILPRDTHNLPEGTQIRRSKLPAEDLTAIARLVGRGVDPGDCPDVGPHTRREIVRDFRVEKILLHEGSDQFIVQEWGPCVCGAVGNCGFWVLQRNGKNFDVLLSDGGFNGIFVLNTSTLGYLDLVFSAHDSATSTSMLVYRFNGHKYKTTRCYNVSYWDQEKARRLKKPDIGDWDCKEPLNRSKLPE